MEYIGHKNKKNFKAMIFAIVIDFKNGKFKPIKIIKAKRLIELYSSIDNDFVQRTIKKYEKEIGDNIYNLLKIESPMKQLN